MKHTATFLLGLLLGLIIGPVGVAYILVKTLDEG